MGKLGCIVVAALLLAPSAQGATESLQRALISFKNHIAAGISYVQFSPAVADVNTEIELAQKSRSLSPAAAQALTALQANMAIMGEVWNLRFGPLGPNGAFTFCQSEIDRLFASTSAAFKEEGLLDADLKTEDLGGQCAYYTDATIASLLSAIAKQADKSADTLSAHAPTHRRH